MNPAQELFTAAVILAIIISLIPPVLLWLLGKRWTIVRKQKEA